MSTRIPVALCGAVALLVLARTGAYYARTDVLALALVVAMGTGLLGALAELLARAGRASELARELARLPRPATLASIDRASEPLRALLRARLAQAGGATSAAPLAGYVVGLLVMLGLLGTFLGLFETLRGAREALTSGGDVEALRASLAAPMQGLTRSFGTSAAGVSASALLGLAAAVVRRTESAFGQALARYSAEALGPLTVPMRQLTALERVAAQGEALPRMVSALEAAAAQLSSLEGNWRAAHADAATKTSAAIRDAIERAGGDIERAAALAVNRAEAALSPLLARAVEGTVAVVRQHVVELEASAAATEARGQSRDAALAAFAAEIASAAERAISSAGAGVERADVRGVALASQVGRMIEALTEQREALVGVGTEARAAVETLLAGAATRAEAFDAQVGRAHASLLADVQRGLDEHAARAEAFSVRATEAHASLIAEAHRITTAEAARAGALLENVREGSAQLVAEVQRGVAEHMARAPAIENDVGTALAAQAERLTSSLMVRAEEREAELRAVATSVRDAAAGMQAGSAELAGVAEMFAGAVNRHREGAAEWLAALGTVEGAIARAANETASRAIAEQLDRARELFDTQLQFHRELLLELRGVRHTPEGRSERRDDDAPA